MFDVRAVKALVDDLCYELDIPHFKYTYSSLGNIKSVKDWLEAVSAEWQQSINASDTLSSIYNNLIEIINTQEAKPKKVYSDEQKKNIYLSLLDGTLTPSIVEHPDGRFSLEDYELIASGFEKVSDINKILKLACSRSYVEGILDKYRPDSEDDYASIFGNTYFIK